MRNASEPQRQGAPGEGRVSRLRSRGKLPLTFGGLASLMLFLGLSGTTAGAATPVAQGYSIASSNGSVYQVGSAGSYGSADGDSSEPIVGIASTPDGKGYVEVASNGGVFAYGDAQFTGSLGDDDTLNSPIVGITMTSDDKGYYLVAADGGVFAFGDAKFLGSLGGTSIIAPITAIALTPDGDGYWLVGADGGVYAFGNASFDGSYETTYGSSSSSKIVGISASPDGGYTLLSQSGGVYAYGSAKFCLIPRPRPPERRVMISPSNTPPMGRVTGSCKATEAFWPSETHSGSWICDLPRRRSQ